MRQICDLNNKTMFMIIIKMWPTNMPEDKAEY